MSALLSWPEAFAAGTNRVGGKAWNLARLDRYGFPVPHGGVLPVDAWQAFAAHNRFDPATITPEQVIEGDIPTELELAIAISLGALSLTDTAVAVRSSAVAEDGARASFAGIHDSILDLTGADAVLGAIKQCWASAFSARASSYRQRMGLACDGIAPAVVVQRLVVPQAAGVAFTLDPASGRQDRVLVAANPGLGESVVQGNVAADQYLVDCGFHAPALTVVDRQPGQGGLCLGDGTVLEIARLALRVRWALGHDEIDQDVEWAWDGTRVHLVQARPVTARKRRTYAELASQPECWSNGNLRDVLPGVLTPMTWSLTAEPLNRLIVLQHEFVGAKPMPGLTRMKPIDGRCYLDASLMQWEYWSFFGVPPALFNQLLGGHQQAVETPASGWRRKLAWMRANLHLAGAMRRARPHAEKLFARFIAAIDEKRLCDVTGLTDQQLVDQLAEFCGSSREITPLSLLLMGSSAALFPLRLLLERFLPGRGSAVSYALLGESAAITSAEHGRALAELAAIAREEGIEVEHWADLPPASRFRQGMEAFLERWGHRAIYELELVNPRWREDPSWLIATIRTLMDAPPQARGRGSARAAQAWDEVVRAVPRLLHPLVRRLAAQAGRDAAQREEAKSVIVRAYEPTRQAVLELGRRLAARGLIDQSDDAFLLTWEEVELLLAGTWSAAGARALIADRRDRMARLAAQPAADVVVVGAESRPHAATTAGLGPVLSGSGVASGQARGKVRVILHPEDGHRLAPGEILVAPSTDPAWTPLFLRAAAVVMETGGVLSHGAIVAREYGLPAVANVRGVLERLRDGMDVLVDGDNGVVAIETEAP